MASLASTYNDWKRRQKDVGCLFARQIALRPADYGQAIEVIAANSSPERIARSVALKLDRMTADPEVSAAVLILPAVKTLETLLEVMMALNAKPGWAVGLSVLDASPIGEALAISATLLIPSTIGQRVPSEALVFGPFQEFPRTRQAPIVAIEIFVGKPREVDPKTKGHVARVNLAHLDVRPSTLDAYEKMWDRSMKGRLSSLGGVDDSRAKAKVAFVVPLSMAQNLGFWP